MAERAWRACESVHGWSQDQTDRVCKAMAEAGARAAHDLARLAVEETGIGRVHYKILKNFLGSEGTWESVAREKTVGVISHDRDTGVVESRPHRLDLVRAVTDVSRCGGERTDAGKREQPHHRKNEHVADHHSVSRFERAL